jgi:hypothetical protein
MHLERKMISMKRGKTLRHRRYIPGFYLLESRRLLSVSAISYGQDGTDLTGPGMSVGADGIQDIHIYLLGLRTEQVSTITITDSTGKFNWYYANGYYSNASQNMLGYAKAEFFQPNGSDTSSNNNTYANYGNLYFNPLVDVASGQTINSSTGTAMPIPSNDNLTFTITYFSESSTTDVDTTTASTGTISNPLASMPTVTTPANVVTASGVTATWAEFANNGQDNSDNLLPPGYVHLHVTGLQGQLASVQLSDQVGESSSWTTSFSTSNPPFDALTVEPQSDNTQADIYFAPIRDETNTVDGESVSKDMTLSFTYTAQSNPSGDEYVTQFAGGPWNPSLLVNTPDSDTDTIPADSTAASAAAELSEDLSLAPPDAPGIIVLPAGLPTIVLTQPLVINHSVQIIGNHNTLDFEPNGWSTSTIGAIYTGNLRSLQAVGIDIESLNINFNNASPIPWFDPSQDIVNGAPVDGLAVINLNPSSNQQPQDTLTMNDVNISGPPAYNPSPESLQAPPTDPTDLYNYHDPLEAAMNLLTTGQHDNGSITDCTFQGGPVAVSSGPWTITDNTDYGAFNGTYSSAAFSANGPHDLIFCGNSATQVDPMHSDQYGHLYRLINLADSGFDDKIADNTFQGGYTAYEESWNSVTEVATGGGSVTNNPEVVAAESSYAVAYEGPGVISPDGNILTLPQPSSTVSSRGYIGPGAIVSIVNALNPDGSANPYAGSFFQIAQVVSSSPSSFYLQTPLPSGQFTFSISSGFVGDQYTGNTINIGGTNIVSTGFVLYSQFGTLVEGNMIIGGPAQNTNYTNTAIIITSKANIDHTNTFPATASNNLAVPTSFPIPSFWTDGPSLGIVIEGNTIEDSPGGISVSAEMPTSNRQGRVYVQVTLGSTQSADYNKFIYDQSFLDSWNTEFHAISADGAPGQNKANASDDNSSPPTISLGTGVQARGDYRETSKITLTFNDPYTLLITLLGNSAEKVNGSSTSPYLLLSGQVLAAVINGTVDPFSKDAILNKLTEDYSGAGVDHPPYIDFNFANLNINGNPTTPPPPPPPANLLDYAFAEPGSSFASGYTQVTQFSAYSSSQGYGLWTPLSGDVNADSGSVYGTVLAFRVDLPAGSYLVTPTLGYQGNSTDSAAIFFQGARIDDLDTGAGTQTKSYVVVVGPSGYLDFEVVGSGLVDTLVHLQSLVILPLQFGFTEQGDPVTAGYTPVSNHTSYTAPGYGFSADPNNDMNATAGAVYATDMTFRVDLPNGLYDVTPTIGGIASAPQTFVQVLLQGETNARTDALGSAAGQSASQTYLAIVTDGYLSLRLSSSSIVYLRSLTIVPQSMPLDFQFGPSGTAVSTGSAAVSNFTIYDPGPGYGFSAESGDMNTTADTVYATDMTFQVDLPDGSYRVTPTLAGNGGQTNVALQGVPVGTVATGSGQVVASFVAVVSDGILTLELSGVGGNYAEIESLAITISTVPTIGDAGFEEVSVGGAGYLVDPTGSSWTFSGTADSGSGLSGNGSAVTSGNPNAPVGSQVAYLQAYGTISQSVGGWAGGTYTISFDAAQRENYAGDEDFEVLVDGGIVGSFDPSGTAYQTFTTNAFTITPGAHTIEFLGIDTAGGPSIVLLDAVAVAVANPQTTTTVWDSSFEEISVGAAGYLVAPPGSDWMFSGVGGSGSGVTGNNSALTSGNPNAPVGSQVAYLQAFGTITQSVGGWAGGTYTISFDAAQRQNYAGVEDFEVLVDGNVVGSFTPSGYSYQTYTTSNFAVTAGSHTIEFLGIDTAGGPSTAFIDAVTITVVSSIPPAVPTIGDSGFEQIPVGAAGYLVDPSGSAWMFSGAAGSGSGVTGNNSALTSGNPNAPDGKQVAYLQGDGTITQSVDGWAAGTYTISFDAAQRENYPGAEDFEVLIDGNVVGTYDPDATATTYTMDTTNTFMVAAGAHTIEFEGMDGDPYSVFLDEVKINEY